MSDAGFDPLGQALKACRRHLETAAAFGLALNFLHLAGPLYMMQVYDRVLGSGSSMTLFMLTLAVLMAYGALAGLDRARGDVMAAASLRLDRLLATPAFVAIMREAPGAGHGQALRDLDSCRQLAVSPAVVALFDVPWIAIYVVVVFALHPALGLFTLACAVLLVGLAVLSEARLRVLAREVQAEAAKSHQWADQSLRNRDAARAMGLLGDLARHWSGQRRSVVALQHKLAGRTAAMAALVRFLRLAMQSLVLGLGAWLAIEHAISPGAIFAASLLLGRALQPVEQVIGQWQAVVSGFAAWNRLGAALREAERSTPRAAPANPGVAACAGVVAERLSFAFSDRTPPLLSEISFAMSPGACIGLIGPSGAGKSTLVRLIVGAVSPSAGHIKLDGIATDVLVATRCPSPIGYLPQDIQLFDDTVAANIARFSNAPASAVVAAAKCAGAHDLIMGLPQGYLTPIGDSGRVLSGGMRQRIGLARAVFGRPRLVVLDEPSANLDRAGEAALAVCVRALVADGAIVVLVTHSPACTALVDRFLVLMAGRLVVSGSREDVVRSLSRGARNFSVGAGVGQSCPPADLRP